MLGLSEANHDVSTCEIMSENEELNLMSNACETPKTWQLRA